MIYSQLTDIGKNRETNEDSCYSFTSDEYSFFIVADGMGGHLAGEVASDLAVKTISNYIFTNYNEEENKAVLLEKSLQDANRVIYEQSQLNLKYANMGTTCDIALVVRDRCFTAHVGDSRIYHYSEGKLNQITRDHSLVSDLIEYGHMSETEALKMGKRNIITRALGGEQKLDVDLNEFDLLDKDQIILITDGIVSGLNNDDILGLVSKDISLDEKTSILINMANEASGSDNSTVIIASKR